MKSDDEQPTRLDPTTSARIAELERPKQIGPYEIVGLLGEGGMGSVYHARQHEPVERDVALKVIKLGMDTREVLARFEAERQALARMQHPGIATVLDAGATSAGSPYVVMELAEGVPVTQYCDEHCLGIRQRLDLFVSICSAVQHAHQKGVVHRDLKPSNVLTATLDDRPVPKIIDFGIAKAVDVEAEDRTAMTQLGTALGTPAYMSPEQAQADPDIDTRTDIYSLGVILYELLVGTLPLTADGPQDWHSLKRRIIETDPLLPSVRLQRMAGGADQKAAAARRTDPAKLGRELSGDLDWIVARAMAKERARRYESVSELAADVRRFLSSEPVQARPPSLTYRARKFARRYRGPLAAAGAIGVVLVVGIVVSTYSAARAIEASREADRRRVQAESLIGFMIGDLRDRLEPVGRLDILDAVGDQAVEYFSQLPAEDLTEQELHRRSQALYQIGEVRFGQGNLPEAQRAFEESLRIAQALTDQYPENVDWRVDLGAAHFWVGYVAWQRGDLGEALPPMQEYLRVAQELVELDPNNLDWQLELAYARINIGHILEEQFDLDGALENYEAGRDVERRLVQRDPDNLDYRFELADVTNAIGKVLEAEGRLQDAVESFRQDLSMKQALVDSDPENTLWASSRSTTRNFLGDALVASGEVDAAEAEYGRQVAEYEQYVARDPTNTRWQRELALSLRTRAGALRLRGDLAEATRAAERAVGMVEALAAQDPTDARLRIDLSSVRTELGWISMTAGEPEAALAAATSARAEVEALGEDVSTRNALARRAEAMVLEARALEAIGRAPEARAIAEQTRAAIEPVAASSSYHALLQTWLDALVLLDDRDRAREVIARLDGIGYRNPRYLEIAETLR